MADIPQGKQECLRYGPSRQDAGATSGWRSSPRRSTLGLANVL